MKNKLYFLRFLTLHVKRVLQFDYTQRILENVWQFNFITG